MAKSDGAADAAADPATGTAGVIAAGVTLTFENYRDRTEAVMREIDAATASPVRLELGGAYAVSSLTVAAVLAWWRHARQRDVQLLLENVPDQLHDIAAFSGLTELLELEPPTPAD